MKKIWPTLAPGTAGEIQATCFALVDLVVFFFGGGRDGKGRQLMSGLQKQMLA